MEIRILARCKYRKISIFVWNDQNLPAHMNEKIRKAHPFEENRLTEIAFAAKHTWDYPENYFEIWNDELTITKEYIEQNAVFVFVERENIVGFYSIVSVIDDFYAGNIWVKKGFWLEHLFVTPDYQHKGFGLMLMEHALNYCKENQIQKLRVFVDPYAKGFYEKLGATFIANSPSSIQGRDVPVYGFDISSSLIL
jgi:maltose O-acetyltransferase